MAADEGRFRLWNPQWTNSTGDDCRRANVRGKNQMTFELAITEAASGVAELGTPADNILNGTGTPVLLEEDSTDALDKDADTGCVRAVHIIGITVASAQNYIDGLEDPVYSVEEVRCDVTAGTTAMPTSRYYLRVIHAYAVEWGSGGGASHDAEGTITIQTVGGVTTYLTIDAASNESNSSGLIYVADGYWGRWNRCYISLHDESVNVA